MARKEAASRVKALAHASRTFLQLALPLEVPIRNTRLFLLSAAQRRPQRGGSNGQRQPLFACEGAPGTGTPVEKTPDDFRFSARLADKVARWYEGGEERRKIEQAERLGRHVRELRQAREWSRGELARRCKLEEAQLRALEGGMLPYEDARGLLTCLIAGLGDDAARLVELYPGEDTSLPAPT